MTPEAKTPMKKLVRLRDALWAFAKLVGGVTAYLGTLALVVGQLTAMVIAEKMSLSSAMVYAVYFTVMIHAVIGIIYSAKV